MSPLAFLLAVLLESFLLTLHLKLDGRSFEAKCVTELIFEIAEVRKVKVFFVVHLDDEVGRVDINLAHKEELWDFSSRSGGLMFEDDLLEPAIQLSGFDAMLTSCFDVLCQLQDLVDIFTCFRGDEDKGCPGHEFKFVQELVSEFISGFFT